MNLKQALYITTIAESGSVSKAAKVLYVTQPSLSQMLKQVEEEVGLKLFDRTATPLRPTYAGEKYLQTARIMLAANERLEQELKSIRQEDSGCLKLGISVSRAAQILPDIVPEFLRMYPNVQLELTESGSTSLEKKLKDGEIDLALATIGTNETGLTYELLEKEQMGVIAGKDSLLARTLPAGTPITVEDLKGNTFICLNRRHSARNVQDQLFSRFDFHPEIVLELDSLNVARLITMNSSSCTFMPSIYGNQTQFYPLTDCAYEHHFYVCYRSGETMPKYMQEMIRIVKDFLKKEQESRNGEKQ